MIEHLESAEQARQLLAAMHARLARQEAGAVSQELLAGLHGLQVLMQRLQTRQGLLLQVLDQTNDLVSAKGRDGRYALINSRGAGLLGKPVSEILGSDDRALLGSVDAERLMSIDREVMRNGLAQTRDETIDVDSVALTLITTTSAWYDVEQCVRGVIVVAHDVTARRHSEQAASLQFERLSSMTSVLVLNEERLRRLLAAELHDGIGQDISLAKLRLSRLRAAASAELHAALIGIEQLVEQSDRSLRSITYRISPPSLHDLGLVAALEWLGEDLGLQYGVEVRIRDHECPMIDDDGVRVLLFRAVRELLVNAAKHASVREIEVRLDCVGDSIRITVEDLGSGFDTSDLDRHGYGLFGIREQLKHIDGTMQVVSKPGSGTAVTLCVPATRRAAAALGIPLA